MPNIKPISDLRNYTSVINEVAYGNRVYLTRNGHGQCAIIDMKELDELDKQKALYELMTKLNNAEKSILEEGTISADELEKELGVWLLKKLEYSHIAKSKLRELRIRLLSEYGPALSTKIIKQITSTARGLETFEEMGPSIYSLYGIECDYRYLYVAHNYLFYRIEFDKIIIVEIFDEHEDFMYKLFGVSTISQETLDYWGE